MHENIPSASIVCNLARATSALYVVWRSALDNPRNPLILMLFGKMLIVSMWLARASHDSAAMRGVKHIKER